ncbi:MAG: LamG domain-containing protein, partial [Kiritimatiellaeota bacterium]|nr:LamG domain-containing protein [Kiritimatiellota bacterium]
CASCHADGNGNIKRFDNWINLERPEMSLVLRAPLPQSFAARGGYGLALCRDRKMDQTFTRRGVLYGFGYEHAVRDLDKFPSQKWDDTWPTEGNPVTPLASTNAPLYQQMLKIIQDARVELLARPRIDMPHADLVGNGIVQGRARQILPQALPDPLPAVTATNGAFGFVRLDWEDSARMIGLIAEIHRGKKDKFKPDATTRIGRTEQSSFWDTNPPPGKVHYAIVFTSDPAETCGTLKSGAVFDYQHGDGEQRPTVVGMPPGERCPLVSFKPERAAPVHLTYEAPKQDRQTQTDILPQAAPRAGSVALAWAPVGVPGLTCYDVYAAQGKGKPARLNKEPLRVPAYMDATFHGMKETRYAVTAYGPTLAERKPPADKFWATAKADPVREEPVFKLAPDAPGLTLTDGAKFEDGTLVISGNGHAKLPPQKELAGSPFSFVLEVMFDEAGSMPVLLGFGRYKGDGWFFQRIGGGWRFHLADTDCDGGAMQVGQWTRLVGTFDGSTARLYQDGKKIAERAIPEMPAPHNAEWRIGQYVQLEPAYQVHGKIRLLEVYSRVLQQE